MQCQLSIMDATFVLRDWDGRIKHMAWKCKDLDSIPRAHIKSKARCRMHVISVLGR